MKILFVQPLIKEPEWFVGRDMERPPATREASADEQQLAMILEFCDRAEPLALELVAACVPSHYEVRILDLRFEPTDSLEQAIADFRPDVVGVTCMFTCSTNITLQTVRRIRAADPNAFIIVGGHAPSLAPAHFDDPAIDAIALGEGELILPPLLERLESGQPWRDVPGLAYWVNRVLHRTSDRPLLVDDLNRLPPVTRHLVERYADQYRNLQRRVALVSTSRGCPFRCTFCAVQQMYGGCYRGLSAENSVDQIERTPCDLLVFPDDNFLVDIPRAHRIAELLLEKGVQRNHFWQTRADSIARHPDLIALWKEAGLTDVFLGLESPEELQLKKVKKQITGAINQKAVDILNRFDINVWGSFIIDPAFDEGDFDRLRQYVSQSGVTFPVFAILTPLPGTELWDQCYDHLTTHNLDYFDTAHAVLPTKLPLAQFYHQYFTLFNALLPHGAKNNSG